MFNYKICLLQYVIVFFPLFGPGDENERFFLQDLTVQDIISALLD